MRPALCARPALGWVLPICYLQEHAPHATPDTARDCRLDPPHDRAMRWSVVRRYRVYIVASWRGVARGRAAGSRHRQPSRVPEVECLLPRREVRAGRPRRVECDVRTNAHIKTIDHSKLHPEPALPQAPAGHENVYRDELTVAPGRVLWPTAGPLGTLCREVPASISCASR